MVVALILKNNDLMLINNNKKFVTELFYPLTISATFNKNTFNERHFPIFSIDIISI